MSYTVPSSAGPQPARPATVTLAVSLLYVVAALQLVGLVVVLVNLGAYRDGYRQAYANDPDLKDAAATIGTVFVIAVAAVLLLLAAGFVTLGILDGQGRNVARIVTWVVAGIGLCCSGLAVVGGAGRGVMRGFGGRRSSTGPDPAEVSRIVNDALPSWYGPVVLAINLIVLLSLIGVVILLATPASHAYFRRPVPTFDPPG
ncbi:MAG TPA: hypothetical protein VFE14_13170 [Micromonosporaceae bacterium]|nr:hypothetical protein [Micromonosporaceae bacterium]